MYVKDDWKTKWKSKPNKQKNKFIYPFKQTTARVFHIAKKKRMY